MVQRLPRDRWGHIVGPRYFGADDEPRLTSDGVAGVDDVVDMHGNVLFILNSFQDEPNCDMLAGGYDPGSYVHGKTASS